MTCYNCNGEGHISRDCPQGGSGGRGRGGRGGGKCRDFFLQFFFSDIFVIFFPLFFFFFFKIQAIINLFHQFLQAEDVDVEHPVVAETE